MTESEPTSERRWRFPPRLRIWLLATLLLWAVAVGVLLFSAQRDARAGESALRSVADLDDPTAIDLDELGRALSDGKSSLNRADRRLGNVALAPLRIVPVVGRQLASTRALVATSSDVVNELEPLVAEAQGVRDDPNRADKVAFLRSVEERLGRLDAVIDAVDLGPSDNLVAPLADGRLELQDRLVVLSDDIDQYRAVAEGMASFLDDGTYLILGSNNSEMRLGSGMHLSVGRLTMSGGEFDLPGLESSEDFEPITGAVVLDEDVAARWGYLGLEDDIRKLGYSARFDEHVAPQALELWRAATGEELDGVLLLDPFVLDALLTVLGGVELDGERFDSSNTLEYLLQDQYAQFDFEDIDGIEVDVDEKEELREERRDRLSVLAAAVADEFGTAAWDPIDLIRALQPVAAGRHLMAYSRDDAEQAGWRAMGIDGALTGDDTGVFWLNTGASKLDPFLDVKVDVVTEIDGDARRVDVTVTTFNGATADLPNYAQGPWLSLSLPEPSSYRGRLAFYAPNGVTDAGFIGGVGVDVFGPDGPLLLVSSQPRTIRPGRTSTIRFYYVIPASRPSVDILPSGRFPSVQWNWDGESFDDSQRRTITFGG